MTTPLAIRFSVMQRLLRLAAGMAAASTSALVLAAAAQAAPPLPGDPPTGIKIVSQPPDANDDFGYTTALSGDTAVVGTPYHDGVAGIAIGAVYVYVRDGAAWVPQAQLLAPEPAAIDQFGYAVAIDGDTLVAGAPGDHAAAGETQGSAYVFVRRGDTWTQQAKLKSPEPSGLGVSVAISGDTIIVGATGADGPEPGAGAAYIFVRSGDVWVHQASLHVAEAQTFDAFGYTVDVRGDTAVLTSRFHSDATVGSYVGGVAVFVRHGTGWAEQALLLSDDIAAFDQFGQAVALGDDLLVAGSWVVDAGGITNTGAAYVFRRTDSVWSQEAKLVASDIKYQDHFGMSVDISGDSIVVGSPDDDVTAGVDAGSAYVFTWSGGSWVQQGKLLPPDGRPADRFGWAVAMDGETVLAGAPYADLADVDSAGAGYLFKLEGLDAWTDLGSGLAGAAGVPTLAGTGTLSAGSPVSLALSKAAPSAPAALFVSFTSAPAPFKGGTLVPLPVALMVPLATGADGALLLGATWPAGVPAGFTFYAQCAIQDAGALFGVALSNALLGSAP